MDPDALDDCEDVELAIYTVPATRSLQGQDAAAKFILMLKEGSHLGQQAIKDISFGVLELFRGNLDEIPLP